MTLKAIIPQGRLSWDDYFLQICDAVSLRSIDEDTKVGCVIVDQRRRIISTGYNGFPAGVDDTFWPSQRGQTVRVPKIGHPGFTLVERGSVRASPSLFFGSLTGENSYEVDKYQPMAHAELNAVVAAGRSLVGCTLYSPLHPCCECAKAVITSGIVRVVYREAREEPSWAVAKLLFEQAHVERVEVRR